MVLHTATLPVLVTVMYMVLVIVLGAAKGVKKAMESPNAIPRTSTAVATATLMAKPTLAHYTTLAKLLREHQCYHQMTRNCDGCGFWHPMMQRRFV